MGRVVTTADGARVAVHDLGGRGDPLLMVHATGFHGMVWKPLAARLAERFHCMSLDLRAHGASGHPPQWDFDWHGFGADVLAAVDGLGMQRPCGVGHSAGGAALLLAEQARPGTFGALYCFEPVVVPVDPPLGPDRHSWLAAAARRRREVFASRDEALRTYRSKPPLDGIDPAALAAYVDHGFEDLADGTVRLRCRREHEAMVAEMATAHDCYVHLASVACPVTLVSGADTDTFSGPVTEVLAARMPRARAEILPGLGHLGPLQDPGAVAASVLRALG